MSGTSGYGVFDQAEQIAAEARVTQTMIDVSADRLEGLRTQCATSAEITQQEIRTLEGKLMKLFSRQLVAKARFPRRAELRHAPSLQQWLRVVGLSPLSVQTVCSKLSSVEELKDCSERELRAMLKMSRDEEAARLVRALHILNKYTDALLRGEGNGCDAGMALYWDSWDVMPRGSPRRTRRQRASVPGEEALHATSTPPSPLPHAPAGGGTGACTTPVAPRRAAELTQELQPLTKSRSHESKLQASNRHLADLNDGGAECSPPGSPGCDTQASDDSHKHTPSHSSSSVSQSTSGSLSVPRSPHTPKPAGSMTHAIAHRFARTFNMIATCDHCEKQMVFGSGLKCKDCKFKCHRECESKVTPSCCLPQEFVDMFKEHFAKEHGLSNSSPLVNSYTTLTSQLSNPRRDRHKPSNPPTLASGLDSSSPSSCNSSNPPSPALLNNQPAPATPLHHHNKQQFHFPEVKCGSVAGSPLRCEAGGARPAPLSTSVSTDSERAARADSVEEAPSDAWPRQNSLSMKEWDIPYDELRLFEVLGAGRFGTVYRGSWHGAVAVKLLNVQYLSTDTAALHNFKHEVATFRKTRHENLVLFMGACMKPPKLAIVTSLCKGMTLHTHIHVHKDKFNANKAAMVAQQIAQGMGYLHARGIVHKDLKSKNIFLENGKVVITDFGLFSVTKLCFWNNARGDSLGIPSGWLCYLAPELVRALRPHASLHLPFSKHTDVFAFGTVWYELLCGEWPFKGQPSEAVIWQVGKGIKQTLSTLQASRDVKDILMVCWSYRAADRPDFARLLALLEKLPRKRLARSPSHPVHLSRSAESVF